MRMERVPSVNLVSANQGLAYQRRFEAIKRDVGRLVAQMVRTDYSPGCLEGCLSSDKELPHGPAGIMPRGQTHGNKHGWTNGIWRPQYWFSLVCNVDQGSRRNEVKDRKSVHKKTFQRENLIKFGDVDQIMRRNEIKK